MDIKIVEFLQSGQNVFFDIFFNIISILASYIGFFIVFIIFFLKQKKFAIYFAICYGISISINCILKIIYNRERPYVSNTNIINLTNSAGKSFPSGHAVSIVIICIFLIYFLYKNYHENLKLITVFCMLFILLVCVSRMYLGQHYLSDVIVGTIIGFSLSIIFLIIDRFYIKKFTKYSNYDIIKKNGD